MTCFYQCICPLPCSAQLQVRRPDSPLQPGAPHSCPAGSCCEPARVHVERLLLFEGVREVEVVDGCHCSTCPEECLRLPALKTFFPDSPWEVTVDVGKCSDPTYSAGMDDGELPSLQEYGDKPFCVTSTNIRAQSVI